MTSGDAVDLTTRVGSVVLPNPVMTASGTAGHGAELSAYLDLSGLDLREADLSMADLTGAVLRGTRLDGATLRDTTLHRADLRGASLDRVDLSAARLRDTRLDLQGAVMLAELHGAEVDATV